MTANTKMTGYWTKVLEIIPVHLYGTLWTERRNSLHILLKETYQAGRAEMAEDVRKACKFEMENHFSGKVATRIVNLYFLILMPWFTISPSATEGRNES